MKTRRATTPSGTPKPRHLARAGAAVLALLLLLPATSWASDAEGAPKRQGDAYPRTTCPVSGEKLGAMGEAVLYVHDGREIRFCCKGCVPRFEKEPAKVLEKIDAAIVADQKPLYSLTECLVSGKKLGSMGEPVDFVCGNRLVRFCCKGCIPAFEKDPAKYLKKLDAAVVEAQKATYPLETCVVSGGKLGSMGEPIDFVHGNRLIRLCCKGCIPTFDKDPAGYAAKLGDPVVWTCPVHPQVRQSSAGRCPLCDRILVKGKPSKEGASPSKTGKRSALPQRPIQHR